MVAERRTLTVEEAGRLLGISRTLAYQAARRGELPIIRIGKRYLVVRALLEQMLVDYQEWRNSGKNLSASEPKGDLPCRPR
jgi:excisionase family DNA binding protein